MLLSGTQMCFWTGSTKCSYYFHANCILVVIKSTHISWNIVFLKKVDLSYPNIHYRFHEPTAGSSPRPDDSSQQPDSVSVENYYLCCPLHLIFGIWHNIVSIVTCSEIDGPEFEPHGGEIFWTISFGLEAPQPPVRWAPVLSWG
jgi:hypothetical protein